MDRIIPIAMPALIGNERRYVNECLESGWISSLGEFIDRFEADFAKSSQVKHAISCCNGTVALHLALLGLGVGPGDEVLVPSLTYVATVNAVKYCGAEPVFVDSDINTWNLDPHDLRKKVTARTKAVIAVHLYGKPAPMHEIVQIAMDHGLRVVEDAAEAIGATYYGQPVGSIGDVATFSFYGNKIITCGEGGLVLTNDDALAARIRQLKGQGQDPKRRYWFPVIGYNYRMTNIQAALGLAQLEKINFHLAARDEIDSWYRSELQGHPNISLPARNEDERSVCWLFSVILKQSNLRDQVMAVLRDSGIDTRPFFYPCHTLPPYVCSVGATDCPNAEWLAARGINLPTYVGMTRDHVHRICDALLKAVKSVEIAEP